MFSVCVPSWINCCQGLYIQFRLFQLLYIQSPPAFQKLFCLENRLDRVLSEDKPSARFKKTAAVKVTELLTVLRAMILHQILLMYNNTL